MSKEKTRDLLLEAGLKTFLEKGYGNGGIEAILQASGVPKGSFYYYFESKEDFGLQVIDRFAAEITASLEESFGDESLPPLERIRRHFTAKIERIESDGCRRGCLAGRLSQELADQSEAFRARLEEIFESWVDRYAECLVEAQAAGEIPAEVDVGELAEFWLNSWQGAILRTKTMQSTAPLRTFVDVVLGNVLPISR